MLGTLAYCLIFANVAASQIAEAPKDYWKTFPNSDADRIVVKIQATEVMDAVLPKLFLENHPTIDDFTIDKVDEVNALNRSITGVNGVAGAKLLKHHRNFAQKLGTISFYHRKEKFDVTIANVGFFMGPDLNDYHLFYSWRLAKLLNDVALSHGPGLSQEGFNSLSGLSSIAGDQFLEVCDGNWDTDRFKIYKQRPANIWNALPSFE